MRESNRHAIADNECLGATTRSTTTAAHRRCTIPQPLADGPSLKRPEALNLSTPMLWHTCAQPKRRQYLRYRCPGGLSPAACYASLRATGHPQRTCRKAAPYASTLSHQYMWNASRNRYMSVGDKQEQQISPLRSRDTHTGDRRGMD